MFQKINLVLLSSVLLLSVTAHAEPSDKDVEQLSFCYGFYSATKNKIEVNRSNAFLKSVNDGIIYDKIVNTPKYRQGYSNATTLDRKQKHICYGMVYGFLGGGHLAAGKKDIKSDLNLAYCMGYMNETRIVSDAEMIQEFCDTEKNLTPKEKMQCVSELTQIIKQNTNYQTGRKDAQPETINPIRVMNCVVKLNKASPSDLDKAMGTHQKSPQTSSKPIPAQKTTAPKKPKPRKNRDTVTTPVFR